MEANNLKAIDVQKRTGVSGRMITYIIKGQRVPTLDVIELLASGLRITPSSLIEDWGADCTDRQDINLTLADKEHLQLIKALNHKERSEVDKYVRL